MKFGAKIKRILNFLEDLIFVNHKCVACGKEIPDGTKFSLCDNCASKMEIIDGKLCKKCGTKLGDKFVELCDECKNVNFVFDTNKSCFYYNEISSKIVKNLKYRGHKYILNSIVQMMEQRSEFFDDIDIITFVPMNKKKLRERGFNQSQLIAEELGKYFGIEVCDMLTKISDGKNQAELVGKERLENLKNSFELKNNSKMKIKNKKIAIIDDIFTTGTTLNECAKIIRTAKPKSIKTITFLKTHFGENG